MRELQNLVHSLVITLKGPLISPRDLPAQVAGSLGEMGVAPEEIVSARRPFREIMAEVECDFLLRAIEVHGSVRRVAELFQIDRSTVFRTIQLCRAAGKSGASRPDGVGNASGPETENGQPSAHEATGGRQAAAGEPPALDVSVQQTAKRPRTARKAEDPPAKRPGAALKNG